MSSESTAPPESTPPPEPTAPPERIASPEPIAAPELRLHPLSFLFALIGQLRQFALPLLVIVFTGRRNAFDIGDLIGAIGVAALVLVSIAQYFTYRYRIESDGVVIRSGLFQRSVRHIPFSRIQNVSLHQNLLHRLFGVAEVRLESAGAAKPEGRMRVLRMDRAQALERLIRGRQVSRATPAGADYAAAIDAGTDDDAAAARTLLRLDTGEVIRQGLVSNRGMLVVGGAMAVLAQSGNNLLGRMFTETGRWLSGQADALHLSTWALAGAVLSLLLAAIVLLRIFSVALALLQFHGFVLREQAGRLSVERGLFTRLRASLPAHRIQAWTIEESLLHRLLGRRALRVDTAVIEAVNEAGSLRELAPIATPETIDALVAGLLPIRAWPVREWQPLHPRAWLRKLLPLLVVLLLASVAAAVWWRPWALLALLAAPALAWRARNWATHSAWSVADGLVTFRRGWISRQWRFAETTKLQTLELQQSPIDRRFGMATLQFDTAGAGAFEPGLEIPCLPEATACEIYVQLSGALVDSRPVRPFTRSRTAASAAPGS